MGTHLISSKELGNNDIMSLRMIFQNLKSKKSENGKLSSQKNCLIIKFHISKNRANLKSPRNPFKLPCPYNKFTYLWSVRRKCHMLQNIILLSVLMPGITNSDLHEPLNKCQIPVSKNFGACYGSKRFVCYVENVCFLPFFCRLSFEGTVISWISGFCVIYLCY